MLLRGARKKAGDIDKGQDRNVEGVAEAHEARGFLGRVDVEHPGEHHRLIGDHTHSAPLDPPKAAQYIARMGRLDLEEIAFVQHLGDDFMHVVGLVGVVGDQRVEAGFLAAPGVGCGPLGHFEPIGKRQKIEEIPRREQRLDIVLEGEIGDAGFRGVGYRAA